MAAKDFEGLCEKEFVDLCMRAKDDDEVAIRKIDDIVSEEKLKHPKNAFDLCLKCCEITGGKKGSYTLGIFYLKGEVVDRNVTKAYYYFDLAVKNGNAAGLRGLRRLYNKGYILVKEDGSEEFFEEEPKKVDYKSRMKGFDVLRRAAEEMEDRTSMIHLAFDYYENGYLDIVKPDLDEAIKWVKKATEGEEGDPYLEPAVLFAARLYKLDKVKSYDLDAYLLDNHFGAVVRILRPDVLNNIERYFFEKGGKEREIAHRIRKHLKNLPRCSNCGLYSHVTPECEYRGPVCYYCHESGHTTRNCPKFARK